MPMRFPSSLLSNYSVVSITGVPGICNDMIAQSGISSAPSRLYDFPVKPTHPIDRFRQHDKPLLISRSMTCWLAVSAATCHVPQYSQILLICFPSVAPVRRGISSADDRSGPRPASGFPHQRGKPHEPRRHRRGGVRLLRADRLRPRAVRRGRRAGGMKKEQAKACDLLRKKEDVT